MNANSYITTDELIYTINHNREIDRGDEMGPFAVKRGKYIYVYRTMARRIASVSIITFFLTKLLIIVTSTIVFIFTAPRAK